MRRGMRVGWLALLCVPSTAVAGSKSATQAEVRRLSEEAERLAQRGAWTGVERAYVQLLALERKGAALTHPAHVLGAHAAQQRGDPLATLERLDAAQRVESRLDTLTWKADIEATYSRFVIDVAAGVEGELTLTPIEPLFDPVQAQTVVRLSEQLAETRHVEGLLPLGRYRLGDLVLESYGGDTQTVSVRPGRASVADPTLISPLQLGTQRFSLVAAEADPTTWAPVAAAIEGTLAAVPGVARVVVVDPAPSWSLFAFEPELFASIGLPTNDIVTAVRGAFRLTDAQISVGASQIGVDQAAASTEALGRVELTIGSTPVPLAALGRVRSGPRPDSRPPGVDVVVVDGADAQAVRGAVLAAVAASPALVASGLRAAGGDGLVGGASPTEALAPVE